MSNILFAIYAADDLPSREKLRDMTIAWSRYGYKGEILDGSSIDEVLKKAAETEFEFCLIQRYGHVIDEQWYLSHWQKQGFHKGIQALCQHPDFLLAGQWCSSDSGCAGLEGDCLLVNLQHYRVLGCPDYGDADGKTHSMIAHVNQSDEREILPGTASKRQVADVPGWHFIQASFWNQLKVRAFTPSINSNRFDLHAPGYGQNFVNLLGTPVTSISDSRSVSQAQSAFIARIKRQIEDAPKGAFLLNIEPYDELVTPAEKLPLDGVFSVAAGFKAYRILQTQEFHSETEVTFYDYSQQALTIRQQFVQQWDGDDFTEFVRYLFKRFPSSEVFYQLWQGATPETLDWQDMEHLWQLELQRWGGHKAFKENWLRCRKLPHKYLHCDLLNQRQSLLQAVQACPNSYIWWSNAFFTIFSHWHYGASDRRQRFHHWITELAQASPHIRINGADHNNVAVNGLTAIEYKKQLEKYWDDELLPLQIHQVGIHF